MNVKKQPPFHPVFFAIYPALALFSQRVVYLSFAPIFRSLVVLIILTALLWLSSCLFYGHPKRSAIFTSFLVFSSFLYYVPFEYLPAFGIMVGGFLIGPHHVFLAAYLALVVTFARICSSPRWDINKLTNMANFSGLTLMAVVIVYLFIPEPVLWKRWSSPRLTQPLEPSLRRADSWVPRPSVYYIVLDGYANSGVLQKYFGHDNTAFISQLRARGFYVAEESRSNYAYTALSLASSLNAQYLEEPADAADLETGDLVPAAVEITHNRVADVLRSRGLNFAAFSTGFSITEANGSDIYLTRSWFLNDFENTLLRMTPFQSVLEITGSHIQYDLHRERIRFVFEKMGKVAKAEDPVFVFAHVVCPHPPFVFDEKGEAVNPDHPFFFFDGTDAQPFGRDEMEYVIGYRNQLVFLNQMVLTLIDELLSQSAVEPIIVIQGDHGPGSQFNVGTEGLEGICLEERFGILNAYHLPGEAADSLYSSISPVNTFRVILNRYFNGDYSLLEDKSFFSPWARPYDLQPVGSSIGTSADVRCRVRNDWSRERIQGSANTLRSQGPQEPVSRPQAVGWSRLRASSPPSARVVKKRGTRGPRVMRWASSKPLRNTVR